MRVKHFLSTLMLSLLSVNAMAAVVDRDNDGLIEINNLDDLNEMRNDPRGTSLRGESAGCPSDTGCFGYELTRNLDFDTNGNGVIDSGDWNGGQPWVPIGGIPSRDDIRFRAVLNGNFHTIRHLTITTIHDSYCYGFIGRAVDAEIRNIGLIDSIINIDSNDSTSSTGALIGHASSTSISFVHATNTNIATTGIEGVGILVGTLEDSEIKNASATGTITGLNSVGGLLGKISHSTVSSSFAQATVTAEIATGGLVGQSINSSVAKSYANSIVTGTNQTGGLIGNILVNSLATDNQIVAIDNSYSLGSINIAEQGTMSGTLVGAFNVLDGKSALIQSSYAKNIIHKGNSRFVNIIGISMGTISVNDTYWVKDPEGVVISPGGNLLSELQCSEFVDDPDCVRGVFTNWDETIWDFGTSSQLPALKLKSNFPWFSTDKPNGEGDYESIARMKEYKPEYACDTPMEFFAKEKKYAYVVNAKTPEKFKSFNAIDGFVCVNADQADSQCKNYEVSYLCDLQAAHTPVWTPWRNDDSPTGDMGDYEDNPAACAIGIRARVVGDDNIRNGAAQKLNTFSIAKGLTCKNDDNEDGCKDYEVRMTCEVLGDRE